MDQLKLLMEYTKFHVGMYTGLCAALGTMLGIEPLKRSVATLQPFLLVTLVCFVVAGAFAGIVGSSLPYHTTWESFATANLGPWKRKWINALVCTHIEHSAFWAGIVVAMTGVCKASF